MAGFAVLAGIAIIGIAGALTWVFVVSLGIRHGLTDIRPGDGASGCRTRARRVAVGQPEFHPRPRPGARSQLPGLNLTP